MSKAPITKRMKQTDIRTSFSHVNRTVRIPDADDMSHASSDTVQDRIDKEPKKENVNVSSDDHQQDKKPKVLLLFRLSSEIYSMDCDPSMTILAALHESRFFRQERKKNTNKDKEVLVLRSKDHMPKAAVKTDFPCCLIDKDEVIDVLFVTNNESASKEKMRETKPHTLHPSNSDEFVTFFIKKRGGHKVVNLLKSKALRTRVEYVCVYARKDTKLKTALKRDGRFNSDMFKKHCALSEFGTESRHEMSTSVIHLDQKAFKVIVLSNTKQPESQEDLIPAFKNEAYVPSDADMTDDAGTSQTPVNTEQETKQKTNPATRESRWSASKEIPDSQEILKLLREQFQDLIKQLKKRENLKNKSQVQKFFREEFAKSVENYLEVKKVKFLAEVSHAVCQIRLEGSPIGTGFLLFDRFILTNAHVISPFAIQENGQSWRLQKSVTTVFDFEDYKSQVTELPVKGEVFAMAFGKDDKGRYLDYALLEQEVEGLTNNMELLNCHSYSHPRPGSQICIVGHPGEGVKKVDACFIIKREITQDSMKSPFHVITQTYMQHAVENLIPYHSCFFHGSSGSPVFDEHCYLIGIHTGCSRENENENSRIFEYAFSLEPILEDIQIQAEKKEEKIKNKILSILEGHRKIG